MTLHWTLLGRFEVGDCGAVLGSKSSCLDPVQPSIEADLEPPLAAHNSRQVQLKHATVNSSKKSREPVSLRLVRLAVLLPEISSLFTNDIKFSYMG